MTQEQDNASAGEREVTTRHKTKYNQETGGGTNTGSSQYCERRGVPHSPRMKTMRTRDTTTRRDSMGELIERERRKKRGSDAQPLLDQTTTRSDAYRNKILASTHFGGGGFTSAGGGGDTYKDNNKQRASVGGRKSCKRGPFGADYYIHGTLLAVGLTVLMLL